ncbi:ribokinase [Treponema brennaborense]|uniref:Ribokinase n=1 Tax=Treponema brennaborense (strain DSM 12168 / CIP 105900 / DD5/3) TaxID=906968 RepID=F4LMF4_TREBD|nr:ribokinase [Treponema brennaborense]AEE15716.1 Ribokinase [Treponema brennaborense DSM 12168]
MKILNFGSINIDYVYRVTHFVRPGETLAADERSVFPGGKGLNQSVSLGRCCGTERDIFHAGCIGRADADFIDALLRENRVSGMFVETCESVTGHTIIQVDENGQNCILLYSGANGAQSEAHIARVFRRFGAGDYLVLQNEISCVAYILEQAHAAGMKIFFNPSPYTADIRKLPLEYVDCFLLNEIEAGDLCGTHAADESVLLAKTAAAFPRAEIVLTLGKRGVVCKTDSAVYRYGTYDVPVVDTTAAGDTFTGYFIGCRALGMDAPAALKYASAASSLAVSQRGAVPSIPRMHRVRDFADSAAVPSFN